MSEDRKQMTDDKSETSALFVKHGPRSFRLVIKFLSSVICHLSSVI
jgi:hypothetical protein